MRWQSDRRLLAAPIVALAAALGGCSVGGVPRDPYVEANEALFDELPSFPGARVTSKTSSPYRETENGPVVGYTTVVLLALPRKATPDTVAAFFESRLSADWRLISRVDEAPFAAGPVLNFRRRDAFVSVNLESWRAHILEIAVDHANG
jgi:hypothetical protein